MREARRIRPDDDGRSAVRRLGAAGCVMLLAGSVLAAETQATLSSAPDPGYVVDGTVDAIARSPDTIYIGGKFSRVGPPTGAAAAVSATTGQPDVGMPKVSGGFGEVYAVAPDGSGGWYVGGNFTHVDGIPRRNLAHVLADKTVDPNWAPDAGDSTDDSVGVLAVASDGTVYVGGGFAVIGSNRSGRHNLAAIDPDTGQTTAWAPEPNDFVSALEVADDGSVYAGGDFTQIGANHAARNRLAKLDAVTANETGWDPDVSVGENGCDGVFTLAVGPGGTVYAGGCFLTVGGVARKNIAALDPVTGDPTLWNPNATSAPGQHSQVSSIALGPDGTVYAGGVFSTIGANSAQRNHLVALDPTTGNATTWNPNPQSPPPPTTNTFVSALAIGGDGTVYVGGYFKRIGTNQADRLNLAAIDPLTGAATSWNPHPSGLVFTLAQRAETVYAGGDFGLVGGEVRENIAALRVSDGTLTNWNPGATCVPANVVRCVQELAVGPDGTIYAGGNFETIGANEAQRNGVAALDPATANATAWNPNPRFGDERGGVGALAFSGNGTVYGGGGFDTIGANAASRDNIAEIDLQTGNATAWNPRANNGPVPLPGDPSPGVSALALGPDGTVYAGGVFKQVGANRASRRNLAAIDPLTANATAWNPNPTGNGEEGEPSRVMALAVGPAGTVYVGGAFQTIGANAASRRHLAAISPSTGTATSWNPDAEDGSVYAVAVASDGTVYVGGNFRYVGANQTVSHGLAALEPASGDAITAFWPKPLWAPHALLATADGKLYAGGEFTTMDLAPRQGFATFSQAPPVPANTQAPQVTGTAKVGETLGCTPGSWSPAPVYYAYQWLRDAAPIAGATRASYTVVSADAGRGLACRVTAHNFGGSASADSAPLTVEPERETTGQGGGGSGTRSVPNADGSPGDRPARRQRGVLAAVRVVRVTIEQALRRGLPLRLNLRKRGAQVKVTVEHVRAQPSGRGRSAGGRLVAERSVRLRRSGWNTLRVRLARRSRRALLRHKRVRLRVRVAVRTGSTTERATRYVTLSRHVR